MGCPRTYAVPTLESLGEEITAECSFLLLAGTSPSCNVRQPPGFQASPSHCRVPLETLVGPADCLSPQHGQATLGFCPHPATEVSRKLGILPVPSCRLL